jgi:exodeoxyribonuclease V beta subunit
MSEPVSDTPFEALRVPLSGRHLIEASAGTGKTFTISTLCLRLILEQGVPVEQLLVVTFTEAATAELSQRIRDRLRAALRAARSRRDPEAWKHLDPDTQELVRRAGNSDEVIERLALALNTFDEAAISTIHGFCRRMLTENAFESGAAFDTELITDARAIHDEIARDYWTGVLLAATPLFARFLQDRKLTAEGLTSLVRRADAKPGLEVLPAESDRPSGDLEDAYAARWAEARQHWIEDRDTIVGQLYRSGRSRRWRAPWQPALDGYFRSARVESVDSPSKLDDLRASALAEWAEKNHKDPPPHPFFDAVEALLTVRVAVERRFEDRLLQVRRSAVDFARAELPTRKARAGVWTFDDLLAQLDRALQGPGGDDLARAIRDRYAAVLVDEWQDTDPVQYRIFDRAYRDARAPVFFIGDPKQAIYAFRGADIFTYMTAAGSSGTTRWTLNTNWRSDPALVDAVGHLFDRQALAAPFLHDDIGFPHVTAQPKARDHYRPPPGQPTAPLQIGVVPRTEAEGDRPDIATLAAAEVARLLGGTSDDTRHHIESGPVRARDIAILVRSNYQARDIERALRAVGVPSVRKSGDSVFNTSEAEDLEQALRAVLDPGDSRALKSALATDLLGWTGTDIAALSDDDHRWQLQVERFRAWHDTWRRRGFIQAFRALLTDADPDPAVAASSPATRLAGLFDGERRLTNLSHAAELLHAAAGQEHLGPIGLVRWLEARRAEQGKAGEDAALRLERDDSAVSLLTVHRSKGLEFPIVICPYLSEGESIRRNEEDQLEFHDPADGLRLKLDLDAKQSSTHRIIALEERLAEAVRLLYVALTRARHLCVVFWQRHGLPQAKDPGRSALGYVLHPPPPTPGQHWNVALHQRLSNIDDAAAAAELEALAADSDGTIEIRALDPEAPAVPIGPPPTAEAPASLAALPTHRGMDATWRVSSFSGLKDSEPDPALAVGRDADPTHGRHAPVPVPATGPRVPLADFPGGPRAGNFFHLVLEDVDFEGARADDGGAWDEGFRASIRRRLSEHGLDPRAHAGTAYVGLRAALAAPFDPERPGLTLAALRPVGCLKEMEFHFPVGPPGAPATFTADALANLVEAHPWPGCPPGYAARLRGLGFTPLRGFLRGFVDLVFEHDGAYGVVDYKSNTLGATRDAYGRTHLPPVMADAHYVLQAWLYVVAVDRHLRARLGDRYDYDRDFAGAYYLFLRGMHPEWGPEFGTWHDKPPRAFVEALSRLLTEGL